MIKNPKRPMIVDTENLKIKVLGTSFNVMSYDDDLFTEITLETGEIEIIGKAESGRENSIGIMSPGERCILSNQSGIFHKETVNTDRYTAWKEGRLVLRNDSMTEIVKKINRWYNVDIIIKDSRLEEFSYRATFVDETLDELLKIFQYTSPIYFKELGREKFPDGTYGKRTIEMYYRNSEQKNKN